MKNLSLVLSFSAVIGLVFVAACAALGVSLPFGSVILGIVGYSCAVGLFAFVLVDRSEEHTSELQSLRHLVCRLLLEKKNKNRAGRRQRNHFLRDLFRRPARASR